MVLVVHPVLVKRQFGHRMMVLPLRLISHQFLDLKACCSSVSDIQASISMPMVILLSRASLVLYPFGIAFHSIPIIAPFFADVNLNYSASNPVTPGGTSLDQMRFTMIFMLTLTYSNAITVTWDDVDGYGIAEADPNAFQVILRAGQNDDFEIEFRYEDINWTYGSASDGVHAAAGYSGGQPGALNTFYELPQSRTAAMADLENLDLLAMASLPSV